VIVIINGERQEIPGSLSVVELLVHLGLDPGRVAIERNRDVLSRTHWSETRVEEGDSYEIVQLVGGG